MITTPVTHATWVKCRVSSEKTFTKRESEKKSKEDGLHEGEGAVGVEVGETGVGGEEGDSERETGVGERVEGGRRAEKRKQSINIATMCKSEIFMIISS